MATIQDLMKQKVIRKVQRSDKGKQHQHRKYNDLSIPKPGIPGLMQSSESEIKTPKKGKMKNGK